jgi:hypothetical protein
VRLLAAKSGGVLSDPECWEVREMDALDGGLLYCHTCGRAWEPGELQEIAYIEGYEDARAEVSGRRGAE